MWGALFYKVYSGFADNLFEMFELAMLFWQIFDFLHIFVPYKWHFCNVAMNVITLKHINHGKNSRRIKEMGRKVCSHIQ